MNKVYVALIAVVFVAITKYSIHQQDLSNLAADLEKNHLAFTLDHQDGNEPDILTDLKLNCVDTDARTVIKADGTTTCWKFGPGRNVYIKGDGASSWYFPVDPPLFVKPHPTFRNHTLTLHPETEKRTIELRKPWWYWF